MPSASRRSPRDTADLTFFVDRSLGRHDVPAVFTDAGYRVVHMTELYPDGADQEVPDDQWIEEVAEHDWVALTKDAAIVRDHQEALRRSALRVFALTNANLTGEEMAERFRINLSRITQRARKRGPFIDSVLPNKVERRWP